MKTFVIGDIHGAYLALKQCLKRSKFNYKKDKLIVLGDIVDGWPDTPLVVEELLKIKNLVLIEGNHDTWAREWFKFGASPIIWTQQGGRATIDSYISNPELMIKHRNFFDRALKYYEEDDRLFVHGGFELGVPIEEQTLRYLTWDRDLFDRMVEKLDISPYKEVFVGHTTTSRISPTPFAMNNVWFLDQGAGWEGKLSIMNIITKEYWQSDIVKELYPNHSHR